MFIVHIGYSCWLLRVNTDTDEFHGWTIRAILPSLRLKDSRSVCFEGTKWQRLATQRYQACSVESRCVSRHQFVTFSTCFSCRCLEYRMDCCPLTDDSPRDAFKSAMATTPTTSSSHAHRILMWWVCGFTDPNTVGTVSHWIGNKFVYDGNQLRFSVECGYAFSAFRFRLYWRQL